MGLSNYALFNNIFENAYSNGLLQSPLYALDLRPISSKHLADSPKILFDEFNQSILDSIPWIPAVVNYHWTIDLIGLYVNGLDITSQIGGPSVGLVDSGTTCLLIYKGLLDYLVKHHY